MTNRTSLAALIALLATSLLAACADETAEPTPGPAEEEGALDIPSFEDYTSGKKDTGYVGNRAAELEATFTGKVRVAVEKTDEELQTLVRELLDNPRSYQHREITAQVTEQTKYARNALKAQKMDLNLEGGSPTFTDVLIVDGGLELHYSVTVESLVKFKELEEQGLTPADLVGRVIEPVLPLSPQGLFEKTGVKCTRDSDTGGTVDPEDVGAHNLFYYFDATQTDCPLGEADLINGHYSVDSSLDAATVYPEYDRLIADGRIDMVAIFGQITHGDLKDNDWGFISFNSFTRSFKYSGFRVTETFDNNHGHRLKKTYPGGLDVVLTIYTPVQFADHVDRDEANEVFRKAVRENEIVYYNGHAFYGSLSVLDNRAAYPQDTYQIINMDACWSYAYYTKQIFRNRSTDEDPDGYVLADVINNTEPGITGSERTAQVLYENIFKGASTVMSGGDASLYSWNKIIEYMNEHAEARARRRTKYPDPEIYGVSGVRTNVWTPGGDDPVDPDPTGTVHENTDPVAVPDKDAEGAKSVITVDSDQTVSGLVVAVEIEHTYIADLHVSLTHGDVTVVLHDHTGGGSNDLSLRVSTEDFAGTSAGGDWILHVVDNAGYDTGAITSWSIEL